MNIGNKTTAKTALQSRKASILAVPGLLLVLAIPAAAQVYQSEDAEGNVSFSDEPSAGSERVDVPATNSADSVAVPSPAPAAPSAPRTSSGEAAPVLEPGIIVRDDELRDRPRELVDERPRDLRDVPEAREAAERVQENVEAARPHRVKPHRR
ncbi:MAG: DUF4124 domain-containing protein [Halieaceae bacterium]